MTGWSRLFCLAVALLVGVPGMAASPDQPRPDPQLTPGATLAVTTADICVTGYTKKVRNVPTAVKRQVYAAYHAVNTPGAYEVDHLIPLELGGSTSIKNLWPESYSIEWNAHIKDELENRLHGLTCRGAVPFKAGTTGDRDGLDRRVSEILPHRPPAQPRAGAAISQTTPISP